MARPHLAALLFQLRRALTGEELANLLPATVRAGAKELLAAERKIDRDVGRNMI